MWRTECGERTLKGAEARVFAEALAGLLNEVYMGTLDDGLFHYELGIRCFDDLTFGQKISVLATIGNGLLREDVLPVELTAVLEGAIAAVFKHLEYEVIYDIDEPECPRPWRQWVAAARQEVGGEGIPPVNCKDIGLWEAEVEELADRILWDSDYEDGDMYLDHPPEKSKELIDWMEIDDGYFTAIAEDLKDEQATATIKELQKFCDSIIKSS